MLTLLPILSYVVGGDSLIAALVWMVVVGVIFYLFHWLLTYVDPPEPFGKVARVILALAAVIILVNVLLGLVGRPFIRW